MNVRQTAFGGAEPQSASSSFATLCKPAMRQALLKLDPRQLIRSPVMLVVEIAAIFTTLLCFAPDAAVSRSVAAQIAI
ncbi:MAG TPA: potassium-transporting ATPase subunit B, partial [Pseudomonas sp.]|nr:potassium-transporting ATPase subunit B [Pseudomonas sp.]